MQIEPSIFLSIGLTLSLSALIVLAAYVAKLSRKLESSKRELETDHMTGVLNRHTLLRHVNERKATRHNFCILLVDVANLKDVNELYGLKFGDGVIAGVAEHLQNLVQPSGIIGRMGGDTFCIIFDDVTEIDALVHGKRIYESPAEVSIDNGELLRMEFCVGIAIRDEACTQTRELFRKAERALRESKALGEGPVVFQDRFDQDVRVRREVRSELSDALKADKLKMHFQPVFDARSGELAALEALMRWPDKVGPAGSPGVFIPIAEETGLILDLGRWSLQTVLKEIRRGPSVPISLNVSVCQLLEPNFAQTVANEIIASGVDPRFLKLEITESVLIEHTEMVHRILRQLREIGVQLALDDFGTGYSSLSYLQKFKFDYLKIDRAFVRELNNGADGRKLLSAIINMGHSMNMKVIAEGVETAEQTALLQLLKADYLQGYFLGVPMPMEKLINFRMSEPATQAFAKRRA